MFGRPLPTLLGVCLVAGAFPAAAQQLELHTVATGLSAPLWAGSPPNDDRLFILEQNSGLIRIQPAVGWGLLIATAAIAGFPPFGVFMSEFLLLTATMKSFPWLTVPLLLGLVIAFAGLFRHLQPMAFGDPGENMRAVDVNMVPVAVHLALVLWLGLAIPGFLAGWFDTATRLISGSGLL